MAAGDSIWKYTAAGLAWALVTGGLNLLFRPNAASAGLSSEEFRVQTLAAGAGMRCSRASFPGGAWRWRFRECSGGAGSFAVSGERHSPLW